MAAEPVEVALGEGAQVGCAAPQRDHPLDADAPGEALPLLRVDAAAAQDARMHHSAAEYLEPLPARRDHDAAALAAAADVDLRRGLGEGEVAGPEAHRYVVAPEEGGDEGLYGPAQVPHVDAPVDDEGLQLVEHRNVGRVRVGAEGAARRDDAQRGAVALHRPYLGGRGVRAQDGALGLAVARGEVEGVHLLARGVPVGDVEGLEAAARVVDVGAVGDAEAHRGEEVDHLLLRAGDGVDAPRLAPLDGQRRV